MVPFSFAGTEMRLIGGRAIHWPAEQALLVADLHLEKGSFFARSGQMLPPYDSRDTLERLTQMIRETGARRIFALGDNFHDRDGVERLESHAAGMLDALTRAFEWVWIAGNHDGLSAANCGGDCVEELQLAGVALRHKASPDEQGHELSGHFHPRLGLTARGRRIVRPCVVISERRMILPAFGAFTGGMAAADPAILAAMQPADAIDAILPASGRLLRYPLWRNEPYIKSAVAT